jgi:hypothetical protein
MGYTTYFDGEVALDKPLTEDHKEILQHLCEADHREEQAKGLTPGIWCQWEPNEDGTAIHHDKGEKFYDYIEWMSHIMDKYLTPWGYKANGCISWDGEESDDDGVIDVIDNVVTSYNIHERAAQLEEGLDKVLSLVPNQLPLFMGINDALDVKVKKLLSAAGDKFENETKE